MKKSSILMIVSGAVMAVGIVLIISGFLSSAVSVSKDGIRFLDERIETFFDEVGDTPFGFGFSGRLSASASYEGPVSQITVDVADADVLLIPTDEAAYRIEAAYSEDSPVTMEQNGSQIAIRQVSRSGLHLFYWQSGGGAQVKLYIPKGASGNDITIGTQSGDITWKLDWKAAETVSLSSVSGDIRGGSITASTLALSSTSGEISGAACTEFFELSTTSGDIRMDMEQVRRLNASSVSGDLSLNGAIGTSAEISTVSGDVLLSLGGSPSQYTLLFNSVSGDSSISGADLSDLQSGPVPLRIGTTSGDLSVQFSLPS